MKNKKGMSIDQSYSNTGYAIGDERELIGFGNIKFDKSENLTNGETREEIVEILKEEFEQEKCSFFSLEDVYLLRNLQTFRVLGDLHQSIREGVGRFSVSNVDGCTIQPATGKRSLRKKYNINKEKFDNTQLGKEITKTIYDLDVDENVGDAISMGVYLLGIGEKDEV